MLFRTQIPQGKILEYEVAAAWWSEYIGNDYLQRLCGRYFAWKVNRKYRRYLKHFDRIERLKRADAMEELIYLSEATYWANKGQEE